MTEQQDEVLDAAVPAPGDLRLVDELRRGDEGAFVGLVERHGPSMLRVARLYVRDRAVAEEIVQEAWLRVLRSLDGFEHRSSLRTWIFVILGNCARRRAERESRLVPQEDSTRFFPEDHPRWARAWATPVSSWDGVPEQRLLSREALAKFRGAIDALPARYATVVTLRDVEGWTSDEVCGLLGISPENQRVLLHRGRAKVRAALEEYFERTES